jgi:ATP synthase subunit G
MATNDGRRPAENDIDLFRSLGTWRVFCIAAGMLKIMCISALCWMAFCVSGVSTLSSRSNLPGCCCFGVGRGDRMKQAKVEAQSLINAYRAEKQEEFNNMVLSKGGSEGSASAKLQADTNKEIQELQVLFQKNAQKAVDILLSKCCEVSLEVPSARVRATQKAAGVISN